MIETHDFAPRLIKWQALHGRHDLPWQQTRDPYRIWLSEIMLQQTQVATVLPYYHRFLARFASVGQLAEAGTDEVMALWAGLGYYSRARNLHQCAKDVMHRFGGVFPGSVEQLIELPGIGRSTAAAIAAFGFDAHAAILDGNVKRVLARVFGVEGFPGEKKVEASLWLLAERLLPPPGDSAIGAYTQGLMDLGATLCVRGQPACGRCPFQMDCSAALTGRQRELPSARPKKALPMRHTLMLIARRGPLILLEKRPPSGIWGGLWSLPEAVDEIALEQHCEMLGLAGRLSRLAPITHTFTHFRLEIEACLLEASETEAPAVNAAPDCCADGVRLARDVGAARDKRDSAGARDAPNTPAMPRETAWIAAEQLDEYGVPAPVRRLLEALTGSLL